MYCLSKLSVSARGAKSATLLDGQDKVFGVLPLEILFPPGNFERDPSATRQNITTRVSPSVATFFEDLDNWAIPYITEHSERLLGKQMTEDEVRFAYVSCVKRPEDKDPMLKLKINMANAKFPCKCWTQQGEEAPFITDWVGITVKARIHCSHFWCMGTGNRTEFGIVCVLTDAMQLSQACGVPF